jgi:excinuclease ABC subunit B
MYADKVTRSMQITIDETAKRRKKQEDYNTKHGLSPQQIKRSTGRANLAAEPDSEYSKQTSDPVLLSMSKEQLTKQADIAKRAMDKAAKNLDFMEAARLRDEFFTIKNLLKVKG